MIGLTELTTPQGDYLCLSEAPLVEQTLIDKCRHASAGAICSFVGTTRDSFQGKQVLELQYEAYVPKAIKTLAAIASEARQLALSGNFSSPSLTANLPGPPSEPAHPVNVVSSAVQPVAASPDLVRIIIAHRLGIVPPTETSIVIVVSCGRRRESFTACEWILEAVKKKAEVWKREMYADDDDQGVWKANF